MSPDPNYAAWVNARCLEWLEQKAFQHSVRIYAPYPGTRLISIEGYDTGTSLREVWLKALNKELGEAEAIRYLIPPPEIPSDD